MPSLLRRWTGRALPPVPPLDSSARRWFLVIVGAAAVLRVTWALQAQEPAELRDPIFYMVLADHLAAGDGYTYGDAPDQGVTAYFPPGYPLFLGAALWLVRLLPGSVSTFELAIGVNVVLSVGLVALVFALGRRLAGAGVGLVAAAITALWPNLIFHSGIVLTETLFLVVFVALLLVTLATPEVARRPGRWRLMTIGVLFGVSALVRPVSLVIAPLFLVLWWGGGCKRALRQTGLVVAVAVAVLVPWAVLSSMRMQSPVLLSLNLGDNLCIGNHADADGGFGALAPHCSEGEGRRPEYETRRQSENIDRALRFIRNSPGEALGLVPDRARLTLRDDHDGLVVASDWGVRPLFSSSLMDALEAAADAYYYVVVAAALAGIGVLIATRGRPVGREWVFLVLIAPAQLASPLVTFGEPRFKMPMYPTLAICAGVAVVAGARLLRGEPFPGRESVAEGAAGRAAAPSVPARV